MRFRIEYNGGKDFTIVNTTADLEWWLDANHNETITDIRDTEQAEISVLDMYSDTIRRSGCKTDKMNDRHISVDSKQELRDITAKYRAEGWMIITFGDKLTEMEKDHEVQVLEVHRKEAAS